MRDYLSLPPSQTDTVLHGEMEWLSHAISGSPWQSSKLNVDADFQATVLFSKPSFQAKAKEMIAVTLRWQPEVTHHHMSCHQSPLCLPPATACAGKTPRAVGVPVGAGGVPRPSVPGCRRACFCSMDPGRWAVTWGWLQDLSWHTAWGGTTGAHVHCGLQCSVTPILPRAPCTVRPGWWLAVGSQVACFGPRGKKNMNSFAYRSMTGTKEQSTLFLKVNTLRRNISELAGILLWFKKKINIACW